MPALASELTVDRRSVRLDESVTIILSLDGASAVLDSVDLPLKNLVIEGEPAVSSEFSWINGNVTRRKTLRYSAVPQHPGPALVGPVVLTGEGGQKETLAPVALQVIPDEAAGSNDPLTILRELGATNRPPCFIVAVPDKTSVYEGEEIIVTWFFYSAASVQRWQIESVPRLSDFWSEELELQTPEEAQEFVGDVVMRKVLLRRVALFPLKSGRYSIGGLKASAGILRSDADSPFGGLFERSLNYVRVPSAPVAIEVKPLPPGPPVDVVGDVTIECAEPMQKGDGPVTFAIGVRGRANLRSMAAPPLEGKVDGETEVESMSFEAGKGAEAGIMKRRWRYVVFPSQSGPLAIPPVVLNVFNPRTGQREQFRCAASTLSVSVAAPRRPATAAEQKPPEPNVDWRAMLRWAAIAACALIALAALVPVARRIRARGSEARAILRNATPQEIRDRVAATLARRHLDPSRVAAEASDRGDAYRALLSILDAVERDRLSAGEARVDVRQRVRDLVDAVGS